MVRKREVSSPDGRCFSVKNEPYASAIPVHPNPDGTSLGSSPHPTLAQSLSHLQRSDPLPQVKLSESPSTPVASAVTQNIEVSLKNESPGIRKRAADTSIETLLLSCTSSPLEHPLPAKCAPSPVTVKSEPKASVYSTETSSPLALKDGTSAPKHTPPTMDRTLFSELLSQLNIKAEFVDSFPWALDHYTMSNSCAAISPGNIKTRLEIIKSSTAVFKREWDSKCQLVKAAVKKNSPINSVEGVKTELLTTDTSGSSSAYSAAASLQSASTAADPKNPRTLQSSNAQDVGNENILTCSCARTDPNPGQLLQSSSVPSRSEINQQSPSTVTTAQPKPLDLTSQASNDSVSREHQVSFHTGPAPDLTQPNCSCCFIYCFFFLSISGFTTRSKTRHSQCFGFISKVWQHKAGAPGADGMHRQSPLLPDEV